MGDERLSPAHTNLPDVFKCSRARGYPAFQTFLTTPFGHNAPDWGEYDEIPGHVVEGLSWCGFDSAALGDIDRVMDDARARIAE